MSNIQITSSSPLHNIRIITIYLGNTCNFDCVYCDRGYIEGLGGQAMGSGKVDDLENFFLWAEQQPNNISRVSFHGGEPFLYTKRIEQITEWLAPICKRNGWLIAFTTNGSLVVENEAYFKKYKGILAATVSYDFSFQEENRELFDVMAMAKVLNENCEQWKWQYVIPIDSPKAFSFESIQNIVSTCYKTNSRTINLIPLRHKRGKDKFDVIIDRLDLIQFANAFLEFLQILYIKKLNLFIDGNYQYTDKAYFKEHSKIILGPDGFMYPEFEFLEYKLHNSRIGQWNSSTPTVWKYVGEEDKILEGCKTCSSRASCGLKYLYKMFDREPEGSCKQFYQIMDLAIGHNENLKKKTNVLEHVGIDTDFRIISND